MSNEDFEIWLKSLKLLHQTRICEYGLEMRYKLIKEKINHYGFVIQRKIMEENNLVWIL